MKDGGIGSPGGHLPASRTQSPVWGSRLQDAWRPAGRAPGCPPVGGHVQLPGAQLGAPCCRPAVSGSAGDCTRLGGLRCLKRTQVWETGLGASPGPLGDAARDPFGTSELVRTLLVSGPLTPRKPEAPCEAS